MSERLDPDFFEPDLSNPKCKQYEVTNSSVMEMMHLALDKLIADRATGTTTIELPDKPFSPIITVTWVPTEDIHEVGDWLMEGGEL